MTRTALAPRPSREKPALLGGKPAFAQTVPITQPTLPPGAALKRRFERILKSGILTNGPTVREFEEKAAERFGVRHAVAVSSCTSGLMLVLKALGLKGEVVMPSFTFHATAHAAAWNGLVPVFADCDPETYTLDPAEAERAVTERTSAIVGVHLFGHPCDGAALEDLARRKNLKLVFDSAHGAGSLYRSRSVGPLGNAEAFSLSPTKLLTSAEGGFVTTGDEALAREVRVGRNYGDPGTYDCAFSGMSARMSELHAALGLESLKLLEEAVQRRNRLAALYRRELAGVPGLSFQRIAEGSRSSYKDFAIVVHEAAFGLGRDRLAEALAAENIVVKKYFYPPVHRQKAFLPERGGPKTLPVTDRISSGTVSLPLYSHMPEETVKGVAAAVARLHEHRRTLG